MLLGKLLSEQYSIAFMLQGVVPIFSLKLRQGERAKA